MTAQLEPKARSGRTDLEASIAHEKHCATEEVQCCKNEKTLAKTPAWRHCANITRRFPVIVTTVFAGVST